MTGLIDFYKVEKVYDDGYHLYMLLENRDMEENKSKEKVLLKLIKGQQTINKENNNEQT